MGETTKTHFERVRKENAVGRAIMAAEKLLEADKDIDEWAGWVCAVHLPGDVMGKLVLSTRELTASKVGVEKVVKAKLKKLKAGAEDYREERWK